MFNMADVEVEFDPVPAAEGRVWRRLIDTASWAEPVANHWEEGTGMIVEGRTVVQPWSIVVWHDTPAPDGSREIPVWTDLLQAPEG